jgi:hypothetical protein
MMNVKMIFGAKRRAGMSREDFGKYWTTEHARKANEKNLFDLSTRFTVVVEEHVMIETPA